MPDGVYAIPIYNVHIARQQCFGSVTRWIFVLDYYSRSITLVSTNLVFILSYLQSRRITLL